MLNIPISLFSSPELATVSKDAVVFYLVLRADIISNESIITKEGKAKNELVSGLTVQTIAHRLGTIEHVVFKVLEELRKRSWIEIKEIEGGSKVYKLGTIVDLNPEWLLDKIIFKPKSSEVKIESVVSTILKPSDIIRRKLAEDRAKIDAKEKPKEVMSDFLKSKFVGEACDDVVTHSVKAKDILREFADLYYNKYKEKCPLVEEGPSGNPHATTYIYIGRAIKWAKNPEYVLKIIRFMFERWDEIKAGLGLDGRPTFNLIGSSKIWPRLVCCFVEGIPKPRYSKPKSDGSLIAHRYDEIKAEKLPDSGW